MHITVSIWPKNDRHILNKV